MPIYEYTCDSCNTRFEKLLKTMSGSEAILCPSCGSEKTSRALSVFAVGAEASRPSGRHGGCGGCAQNGACPMQE